MEGVRRIELEEPIHDASFSSLPSKEMYQSSSSFSRMNHSFAISSGLIDGDFDEAGVWAAGIANPESSNSVNSSVALVHESRPDVRLDAIRLVGHLLTM